MNPSRQDGRTRGGTPPILIETPLTGDSPVAAPTSSHVTIIASNTEPTTAMPYKNFSAGDRIELAALIASTANVTSSPSTVAALTQSPTNPASASTTSMSVLLGVNILCVSLPGLDSGVYSTRNSN